MPKKTKRYPHQKLEYYCYDCGGNGICEHGKRKYYCPYCGGEGICWHGKQKYDCRACGGNGLVSYRSHKGKRKILL